MLTRRGLIGTLLAAPAIIRTPGLLMPVKAIQQGYTSVIRLDPELVAFAGLQTAAQLAEYSHIPLLRNVPVRYVPVAFP